MLTRLLAALMMTLLAGCGQNPSGSTVSSSVCDDGEGPTDDTVTAAIEGLAQPPDGTWQEVSRGNTVDCRLHWVQAANSADTATSAPQVVLFFDRNTPLGPATPEPRPFTTVVATGDDTVSVQYQWETDTDAPNRPTGVGTVRFRLDADGALTALDPIPDP